MVAGSGFTHRTIAHVATNGVIAATSRAWRSLSTFGLMMPRLRAGPTTSAKLRSRKALDRRRFAQSTRASQPRPKRAFPGLKVADRPKAQYGSSPDSPLEGTGSEPSVPLLRNALLGVANRTRLHEKRSHLQVQVRDGDACPEWLPIAFPFTAGPRVGIRLPPAESQANHRFLSRGAYVAHSRALRRPADDLRTPLTKRK